MKYLKFLGILLIVSSCGGGGGGGGVPPIPFALTLGITSFSVNEDTNYSGSISASANEVSDANLCNNSPTILRNSLIVFEWSNILSSKFKLQWPG